MSDPGPERDLVRVEADPRLAPVWTTVQQPHVATLSIDVFDTLLWRAVTEPSQAFVVMAPVLRAKGLLPEGVSDAGFARMRVEAERRARIVRLDEQGTEEATLPGIWAQLARVVGDDAVDACVEAEVALECSLTRPDLGIAALTRLVLSKLDKRVQLVSDTYFSGDQLRRLLDKPETAHLLGVPLATSSDFGVGKGLGLFQRAHATWGVDPGTVVHLGDNPVADVICARDAGAATVHYPQTTDGSWDVLRAEKVQQAPLGAPRVVDPVQGDVGLTALRSRVVQGAGSRVAAEQEPFWRTGAMVMGPALAGFGAWVHARARAHGASTVFCLRREGEFLAEVVNAAAPGAEALGHEPVRAEPVWASRRALLHASLVTVDETEVRELLKRRRPCTVRDHLADLSIPLGLVPGLGPVLGSRTDLPGVEEQLVTAVTGSAELRQLLLDRARTARERLVAHLARQLPASGTVVLVDIGWGGTVQRLLGEILARRGDKRRLVGLYLATHFHAELHALDGLVTEGFVAHHGEPAGLLAPMQRSAEIFEQVCLSPGGSLLGFGADLEPQLGADLCPPAQQRSREVVQAGALAFVSRWCEEVAGAPALLDLTTPAARLRLLRTMSRLASLPLVDEAMAFGGWVHDDNHALDATDAVLGEQALDQVRGASVVDLEALHMSEIYWPAGAAVLTDPVTAQLLDLSRRGVVAAEAVSAVSEAGHVEVYVDEGDDFHRGPWVHVPAHVVGNARVRARAHLVVSGVHRLRIDPGEGRALVRLDALTVVLQVPGESEPVVLECHDGDAPGLKVGGATRVGRALWELDGEDPMFVVEPALWGPLAATAAAQAVTVEVDMRFAVLPLPGPLSLAPPAPEVVHVHVPVEPDTRTAARLAAKGVARRALRTLRPPS